MATIDIGTVLKTQIPGYADPADIQAALKLYHYGTTDPVASEEAVEPNSVAGHIKALKDRVAAQETLGVGSEYSATKPTSPVEGFLWVDSTSVPISTAVVSTANYQTTAPTLNLTSGMLWVDSDSSPLKMYVYNGTAWQEIGA